MFQLKVTGSGGNLPVTGGRGRASKTTLHPRLFTLVSGGAFRTLPCSLGSGSTFHPGEARARLRHRRGDSPCRQARPGPAPACGAAGPNHAVGPRRLKPRPSSAGPSHRGAPAGSARPGRLRSCVQREEDSSPRGPTRPDPRGRKPCPPPPETLRRGHPARVGILPKSPFQLISSTPRGGAVPNLQPLNSAAAPVAAFPLT